MVISNEKSACNNESNKRFIVFAVGAEACYLSISPTVPPHSCMSIILDFLIHVHRHGTCTDRHKALGRWCTSKPQYLEKKNTVCRSIVLNCGITAKKVLSEIWAKAVILASGNNILTEKCCTSMLKNNWSRCYLQLFSQ